MPSTSSASTRTHVTEWPAALSKRALLASEHRPWPRPHVREGYKVVEAVVEGMSIQVQLLQAEPGVFHGVPEQGQGGMLDGGLDRQERLWPRLAIRSRCSRPRGRSPQDRGGLRSGTRRCRTGSAEPRAFTDLPPLNRQGLHLPSAWRAPSAVAPLSVRHSVGTSCSPGTRPCS